MASLNEHEIKKLSNVLKNSKIYITKEKALATKSDTDILKDKCNTAIKCIFLVFLANVFLIMSLWFK